MSNKIKNTCAALALGLLTATSASANSLTFQGVTFNTWAVDGDTMGLSILGALTSATGNWTNVNYLSAFEIKDIGAVTGATIVSGPGFVTDVDQGLANNVTNKLGDFGCTTGGTPGACFFSTPPVALTDSMSWLIDFTGTNLSFLAPHLKVQFLTNANDTKATGDLLSRAIPTPVPEPETFAMLLTGIGLMSFVARRRKRQ